MRMYDIVTFSLLMDYIHRQLHLAPHIQKLEELNNPPSTTLTDTDNIISDMKTKVKRLKSLQLELNKPPGIPAQIAKSPRKPKKAE